MITADTSVRLRVAALESGCTDFLTKPIVVPEMLARAQNLLRLRLSQRMLRDRAAALRSRVEEATAQLRQQAQELVARLARAAEYRDPETGLHIERIANCLRVIAESLGMDPDDRARLAEAAPCCREASIPSSAKLRKSRWATTRRTTAPAIPKACGGRRFRWPAASSPSPTSSTR